MMRRATWTLVGLALAGCSNPSDVDGGTEPLDGPTLTSTGDEMTDGSSSNGSGSSSGTTTSSASVDESGSTGSSTTTGEASGCAVVGVEGVCGDVTLCPPGSSAFLTPCEGTPAIQCCVPAAPSCSVDGAPGLCLDTSECGAGLDTTPGLCPGDASVQCCTDPTTACDPDAMPRPNEALTEASWDVSCPDGMVRSDDFCVDRFEASLVELDGAGSVVASWSPYFTPGTTRVRAVSLEGSVPQGYITQVQAAEACQEAGKRMCSDAEWLRACQGSGSTTYPYGDTLESQRCNDSRERHPVIEYFGTSEDWIWSELGHPCISQIPASLDITGSNDACASEDGALDMMGNLHEWTSEPAGTFRGGFYADTEINGPGCLYATTAHNVQHWDYSTGFRCCAD